MNIIGIIPARMASSRLPNKPLAKIIGVPMIGHVYFRSKMCDILNDVYVATCDEQIQQYIESIGGKTIMTSDKHERASDRTAEALLKIEKITGKTVDIVVMIQGDEPMVTPEMISAAVYPLIERSSLQITNLMENIETENEHNDPAEVKVVVDKNNNALYFSREPIPSRKKGGVNIPMLKQVCIIPFRRDFLLEYNLMDQTPLEIIESVDMNRLLENGIKIKMVMREEITLAVDTDEDLKKVNTLMKSDSLIKNYIKSED
ncbi:3-deoxy-manno-octulosonate cytidylyltransferase [Flavobacteriaceae bacterium]|nr:3-deoxy-manno-octulosonate cytidylyltransferase [Flavobacteriaceae bacterium]